MTEHYDPIGDGHDESTIEQRNLSICYDVDMHIPEMHVDRIIDEHGEDKVERYLETIIMREHDDRFETSAKVTVGITDWKHCASGGYRVTAVVKQ